jgi:capsular polysaccharide biosynthesis protein
LTSPSLFRILAGRWYILVAGLLLSLILAAIAYSQIPPRYTSRGTAVLLQPQQRRVNPDNPLLSFDKGQNTTASIVVQALSSPQVPAELGLTGRETFSVKNSGGDGFINIGADQPFISVTAQSSEPTRSPEIVAQVMARAQQELANLQGALQVSKRNNLMLESIIDPTPAKRVLDGQMRALGAVLLVGIAITVTIAWAYDQIMSRRNRTATAHTPDIIPSASVGSNGTNRRTDVWSPVVTATTNNH